MTGKSQTTELSGLAGLIELIENMEESDEGESGVTVQELADALGFCKQHASSLVRKMIKSGAVVVGRGFRRTVAGQRFSLPVYRPAPQQAGRVSRKER